MRLPEAILEQIKTNLHVLAYLDLEDREKISNMETMITKPSNKVIFLHVEPPN